MLEFPDLGNVKKNAKKSLQYTSGNSTLHCRLSSTFSDVPLHIRRVRKLQYSSIVMHATFDLMEILKPLMISLRAISN